MHPFNFDYEISGVSSDTVFTVSVTIGIFILGILFRWLYDSALSVFEKRSKKRYFLANIKKYSNDILSQVSAMEGYIEDYSIDNQLTTIEISANLSTSIITKSFTQQYFDIFSKRFFIWFSERKSKLYNTAINNIMIVTDTQPLIKDNLEYFASNLTRHKLQFFENRQKIVVFFEKHASMFERTGQNPATVDQFFNEFAEIYSEWHQSENFQNIFVCKEKLITRVKELALNRHGDPRSTELIFICNVCLSASGNVSLMIEYIEKQFSHHTKSYKKANKVLNEFLEENNIKIKD